MSGRRDWLSALYAAGVTPASFLPDASGGRRGEPADEAGATVDLIEDAELRVHPVVPEPPPATVGFLDGIQQWRVVGYDGVQPIAVAYVAAAVRRRGRDGRLRTAQWAARELVVAPSGALDEARRQAITDAGLEAVAAEAEGPIQPGQALEVLRREVHRARQGLERAVGRRAIEGMAAHEWLVVDGQLAVSAILARHPRTVGVIKSHGAQFLEGRHLERALTVPAGHRTGVFRVHGGHGRTEVDSWYLRLWPWEGRDLYYGLIRMEMAAAPDPGSRATAISNWLFAERATLAAPDARFDRLLYPIHDVETYLRSRAPRDLSAPPASRLPRTGT
jgi:hypothetical protein